MKILVMGMPGSGKTTLAKILAERLNAVWLNADQLRQQANDWDFSQEGRIRQAIRMYTQAEQALSKGRIVVADFICPTEEARKQFKADYTVWMDTIVQCQFEDTNKMFVRPSHYDFRVTHKEADMWAYVIMHNIRNNQ